MPRLTCSGANQCGELLSASPAAETGQWVVDEACKQRQADLGSSRLNTSSAGVLLAPTTLILTL